MSPKQKLTIADLIPLDTPMGERDVARTADAKKHAEVDISKRAEATYTAISQLLEMYNQEEFTLRNGDTLPTLEEKGDLASLWEMTSEGKEKQSEKYAAHTRKEILDLIQPYLQDAMVVDGVKRLYLKESIRKKASAEKLESFVLLRKTIPELHNKIRLLQYQSMTRTGHIDPLTAHQMRMFNEEVISKEKDAEELHGKATTMERGFMISEQLREYKKQMQEKGYVLTPSRAELLDKIKDKLASGQRVLLLGFPGTGKTELAIYAFSETSNDYEMLSWHEGTTTRDAYGYRELSSGGDGKVQSEVKPGPVSLALMHGRGVIHDEFNLGSTKVQLGMKATMNSKVGDLKDIPGFPGQKFTVAPGYGEIATGNPKNETTSDREEIDPALRRMFHEMEVSFMPEQEQYHILLAQLMQEDGTLPYSKEELTLLEKLVHAASLTQMIHAGTLSVEVTDLLKKAGLTEEKMELKKKFLDPGTLFSFFKGWEGARILGKSFSEYIEQALKDFLGSSLTKEERETFTTLFTIAGLTMGKGEEMQVNFNSKEGAQHLLFPSDLGFLDPAPLSSDDEFAEEGKVEDIWDDAQKTKGQNGPNIILNGETAIEKKLNFIPEFQEQMKDLEKRGVLIVQNGIKGIVGWDNKFYKAPTEQEVLAKERAFDQKLLEYKISQEMTQVLLVDFASSWVSNVKLLTEMYKKTAGAGKLLRTDDARTKITKIDDTKFWLGEDENNVLYLPRVGDPKSKTEAVDDGFKMLLLPHDPRVSRKGQGLVRGGRPDLTAEQTGNTYRELLSSGDPMSVYRGEQGLTLEAWLSWAFLMLRKNGQVLHDYYENPKDSGCWLTGTQLKNGTLPVAFFNRDSDRVLLYNGSPEDDNVDDGGAGSVEIC